MRRTINTAIIISCIVFFCGIVVMGLQLFFRLETIEVVGRGAVFSVDTKKLSTNVLFFPTKTLEIDLRTQYPLFQTVHVYKKYPHTIIIDYLLKDPWAYIESGGHTYGVDEKGVVVGEYSAPFIHPILLFDIGPQSVGTTVTDRRVKTALSFLKTLDSSLRVSTIKDAEKNAIEVIIASMQVIISVDEKDIENKSRALLFLYNGFNIKGVLPSIVDLRYEKPIITK